MLNSNFILYLSLILGSSTIESITPPPAGQIKNGKPADKNAFNYMVALMGAEQGQEHELFGAGSILSDRWILTTKNAAMDTKGNSNKLKELVVSPIYDNDLKSEKMKEGKKYTVDKYYCPHKAVLDWTASHSDLALLKLKEPIPLGQDADSFKSIKIGSQPKSVQDAYVAGWGFTGKKESGNPLQFGSIRLFSTRCLLTCKIMIRAKIGSKTQVCTGDVGGPVVSKNGDGPDTLLGVVSSYDNLCLSLNVFINATTFKPWIDEVMTKNPESHCPR